MSYNKNNKAVFLDRDGTLNLDYGYVSDINKLELLPSAIEGLHKMREMGFHLLIISNQSGIGRGYYTLEDYFKVNSKLLSLLKEENLTIDECYYCPHSPESNCECRKPGTKMLENAAKKWNIDESQSFMIGDKETDIKAGNKFGVKTILISNEEKNFNQNFTAKNLLEACEFIKNNLKNS